MKLTTEKLLHVILLSFVDHRVCLQAYYAFIYLLRPQLEKLRDPIEECFTEVFQYLDFLSGKIMEKTFIRFPQAINDMTDLVSNYLQEERERVI